MKKILGLDLGTNSIGWAVVNADVNQNNDEQLQNIEAAGSRIIPMDAAILGNFDAGNSKSQTSERTGYRGVRRLRERCLLRRERLLRVLNLIGFLPEHFAKVIDRYGKFLNNGEPKLPWRKNRDGKFEFIFQDSFKEMMADFRKSQPDLLLTDKKIPYDWTIYFLRKKALTQKITKEELAWILLNFNQKRGYYQLRGEDEEENPNKLVEYSALKVVAVEDSGEKKGKDTWYNVLLENDWVYRRTSSIPLDWVGITKEFIVTTDLNDDGTPKKDKDGNVKRSFRIPKDDDWTLMKKKTEADIEQTHKMVGTYIYDTILQNPSQKIRGKLVRTIERKYYKAELKQILEKQKEFHTELRDLKLYNACLEELYSTNDAYRKSIANRDFTYLFIDDIIFYQRPLKSKKSLIDNCPYESRYDKNGNEYSVKCIAKSQPLFQEFRLWQFVSNLRIFQRERESNGKLETDINVTQDFLTGEDDFTTLFDWLNDRKEIDQDTLIGTYFKIKKQKGKDSLYPYRWNYVEEKKYPCNETRAMILSRLEKAKISSAFLTKDKENSLWHILYSIEDKQEIEKALKTFAIKNNLSDGFVDNFKKFPPFKKDYGAYSAKAIQKLLPLMRMGKYWSEEEFDDNTRKRIDKIITSEYDENIKNRVREKAINLTEFSHFRALPVWLACYIVYNRHSEAKEITKWENPSDIDNYLKTFKQHSLRNPIVEQVITETLRTVRDIWKQCGHIDEIHVELGREMKNPADKRAKITAQVQENENTNLRIKAMLAEFSNPSLGIANVRPYSPSQQDILRIYEEYALSNLSDKDEDFEFVSRISKKSQPSKTDIIKYKAWLEQKYRSPYTGAVIPLSKLFTSSYEIEHIIPQSRYFDDSFSNKVICESEVNKLKDRLLGYEFIKTNHGQIVQLNGGKTVTILEVEAYETFVKDNYSRSRGKMRKLLMDDIPEKFIERQLNDSRYISKVVKMLLSNIVREKNENGEYEAESTSKNVISCTGGITDRLKKDWGMNDVWNKIVLPRFERLNQLTGKNCFTATSAEGHTIPAMPLELQKGFNKKRIDHRHHAMDAIVIACASRNIVNYLNNESASKNARISRYDLQQIVCDKKTTDDGNYKWIIKMPWKGFTENTHGVLDSIIVSFKQNMRVINKTVNYYQHFENGKKVYIRQEKGDSWAIRKSMHKETIFGEVNLRKSDKTVSLNEALKNPKSIVEKDLKVKILELISNGMDEKKIKKYFDENKDAWQEVNLSKIPVYYFTKNTHERYFATRKTLDTSFDRKKIETSITDTGIQKILLAHLDSKGGNSDLAFSPDGIDEMNRNIKELNGGINHQPIIKVRYYEKADKFAVGQKGNKSSKFVEAAKGTNLFFAIYQKKDIDNETGEEKLTRSFASIPLNIAIEREKQGLTSVPEANEDGGSLLFVLSPNDLVYLPTCEQIKNGIDHIDKERIYKFVSGSGFHADFIACSSASVLFSMNKKKQQELSIDYNIQDEFGIGSPKSKNERAITGEMVKETCIPIKVDRLGNIINFAPESND